MRRFLPILLFLFVLPTYSQQSVSTINGRDLFEKAMNALTGSGISRDSVIAVDYFRRSANTGYAPAQVVVGYFEETGTFVPREPQDAIIRYTRAAEQNDRLAQWAVGKLYFTGDAGTRDLNKAAEWLTRAAGQGDPFGAYLLARIKLERQDYAGAVSNFRLAAQQGLPQAQKNLAVLLKDGKGVSVNKAEAYIWLLLSTLPADTEESVSPAVNTNDLLSELEASLGSTQVERAKNTAREMESAVNRSRNAHGCSGWPGEFNAVPTTPPPDIQKFCR